jgi:hypothetical protein
VSEALGLSAEQRSAIAEWAAGDANWQARERVRVPRASAAYQGVSAEHRATEVTATCLGAGDPPAARVPVR